MREVNATRLGSWSLRWSCLLGLAALMCWPAMGRASGGQQLKPNVEDRVKRASVLIFTAISEREKGDKPMGSGSGFFINSTGLAVSNNHVVDPTHMKSPEEKQRFHYGAGRLTWFVIVNSGTDEEKRYDAIVLYQNEAADQALLQVYEEENKPLSTPHYLPLLPESQLEERMPVWALGFPGGDAQRVDSQKHAPVSITSGHVLEYPRTPGGRIRRIFTDVIARPGNSGGPMVNADGYLVGAVTLMDKPEGREDTGGANYSALSPATLTAQMVEYAFVLGKIPQGTDVIPFVDALPRLKGRLSLPEYERLPEQEVLFFSNGDRIYGNVATDEITWPSKLGDLKVPVAAAAYIINNTEGSHLFLEGGNHIASSDLDATFKFKPQGGEVTEIAFDSVRTIGFRTADRTIEPVSGEVTLLSTDTAHLVLRDAGGTAQLEGRLGAIDVKLEDIERVRRMDDGSTVVVLKDGRRMTGRFAGGKFEGTIAATGMPVSFSLAEANWADVRRIHQQAGLSGGLGLAEVLRAADPELKNLVRKLEQDEIKEARTILDDLADTNRMRRYTDAKKEQIYLLEGVVQLREGKYADATRSMRRAARATDGNVAAYASAIALVLKEMEDDGYKHEGEPISERSAFAGAGAELSDQIIGEARSLLRNSATLTGATRGEYTIGMREVEGMEKELTAAAIFRGTDAEDELVRIWQLGFDLSVRELERLDREEKEQREGGGRGTNRGRGRGQGAQLAVQRQMEEIARMREAAQESARAYSLKRWDYGFRIEDPDVRAIKERQGSET